MSETKQTTITHNGQPINVQALIELALQKVAARPGAPAVHIEKWTQDDTDSELTVRVGDKLRVMEVSKPFLRVEPDMETLRKVAIASRELIEGENRRVRLNHRGVFGVWAG
jgi:hypothetical protein